MMQRNELCLLDICKFDKVPHAKGNLFLGGQLATQDCVMETHKITHVFHIGFEPFHKIDGVYYEFFDITDEASRSTEIIALGQSLCPKIMQLLQQSPTNNVLVCCQAGRSRSASIIVMFFKCCYPTWTFDACVSYIKKFRQIAINAGFAESLKRWCNDVV